MIRKAILVVLTLAAAGMAVIEVTSFRARASRFQADRLLQSDVFFCTSRDGVLNLFFHRCPRCGSYGKHVATCSWLVGRLGRAHLGMPATLYDKHLGPFRWRVSEYNFRRSYVVTLPTWAPLVVLAAYPTIAFIRGPLRRYRRRRKGLCLTCGYNLTGLTEPRCPECATEFDSP